MINLQKVIQDKTVEVLAEMFSKYVESNMDDYHFNPVDWEPDWELVSEEVATSDEVINATVQLTTEYGKSVLDHVKEEERQYHQELLDEGRYIASHQPSI